MVASKQTQLRDIITNAKHRSRTYELNRFPKQKQFTYVPASKTARGYTRINDELKLTGKKIKSPTRAPLREPFAFVRLDIIVLIPKNHARQLPSYPKISHNQFPRARALACKGNETRPNFEINRRHVRASNKGCRRAATAGQILSNSRVPGPGRTHTRALTPAPWRHI